MSEVRQKAGARPKSKQTLSSGIWTTDSSPATEEPRMERWPKLRRAYFWVKKDLAGRELGSDMGT